MSHMIEYRMSFTAKDGTEASIVGHVNALEAIEKAFEKAGIKYNDDIETWDEGFYDARVPHPIDSDPSWRKREK